ncbi:class I SAM-dependent methyltransferase [Streptomyces coeruleorubidus]|uniref:class I SAM-dependent methyltransferase n=1 Tax=Streptomyces coeruleorubidus TaxID=116188 RepID=UPI00237F1BEF|nr:class I SAM-dependent methyltransferase [Streptomyces coeruleorubidus]WDV51841.1 class I SAM-dependent methyltransferase [Streptomyces coeruleorubidus]
MTAETPRLTDAGNEATSGGDAEPGGSSSAYGESLADVYDSLYPAAGPAVDSMVAFLQELRPAPAALLELGVGTGRLAIPLAKHGYRVHGVDASPAMLAKLHENDSTGSVTTAVGDFSALVVEERYDLVLTALNTFFMLPTQEQQISCLRGIHDALADGGVAVFETYNPQVYHRLTEATTRVGHLAPDALLLDTIQVNQALQSVLVVHTIMSAGGLRKVPEVSRYAWPAEFDVMARLAGLRVTGRWADWDRSPVTDQTEKHVYVVERRSV